MKRTSLLTRAALVVGVVVTGTSTLAAQTVSRDAAACAALTALQIPGVVLSITKAEWIPGMPAHCRLDGVLDGRTGADGKPYGIGFAVALPGNWNGRFLFQGGGGLNGSVRAPLGAAAAGSTSGLARGFAVVSTDTGHQGQGAFDGAFRQEQQANLDFAYSAVGRVATLAKQIIAVHYTRPADHSYFVGCSTGGREAMLMAQRYPTYFDGVVAGAPAMRTNFSGIGDEWVATMLNAIAPKDASGRPLTRQALSESDKKTVIDGVLNACDGGDGIKDGMVFNTQACTFDPKTLVCNGSKQDGCLSIEQALALEKGFAGPKDSKGRQVYPGFLFDTGIAATQGISGLLHGGQSPTGPGFSATTMNVDARAETAAADPSSMVANTWSWTNLNTFSSRGGKLVFYHGVSDPWFSALDTIDYYERLTKTSGGPERVRQWSRLFLAPGMGHCSGGTAALDSFDLLTAIVDWVENGVAPTSVTATGRALPGRSRPLCPYPQYAHYTGRGDPQSAASFECRAPR